MSDDDCSAVSIREGGAVDGEQYYVVAVRDTTGEFLSAAVSANAISEFVGKAERVLGGELQYGKVEEGR